LIDLLYGTLRGIILKDGPRSGTQVRSRTIAMGVRGTDFQIGANDTNGYAKVTVLRGSVIVRPTTGTATNPITGGRFIRGESAWPSAINGSGTTFRLALIGLGLPPIGRLMVLPNCIEMNLGNTLKKI
jgi:hypothetical protein